MHHSVPFSDRIDSPLGFSDKRRRHGSPYTTCGRKRMKTEQCMTQTDLAEHWRLSGATLERWRTESGGPLFLKLGNQVRYRLQDVEAFEEAALREVRPSLMQKSIRGSQAEQAIGRFLGSCSRHPVRHGLSPSTCAPVLDALAFALCLAAGNADRARFNLPPPKTVSRPLAPYTPSPQCRRWGCSQPPVAASSGGSRPRRSRSGPFPGR